MKVYIFDIETYFDRNEKQLSQKVIQTGKINFGIAVVKKLNTDNFQVFYSKKEFQDFIFSFLKNRKKDKIYFVGFNIFNFDILTLFDRESLLRNFNIVMNKNYKILEIESKNRKVAFYDLFNIFSTSLRKLAEYVNLEKGELQQELAKMNKDEFEKRKNEIVNYCKNDVIITEKVFSEFYNFLKQNNIKTLPITASQLSFKLFNKLNNNLLDGRDIDNDYLFLESYFGGRVEYFFIGKYNQNVYAYDFNSLYPYVMQKYKYPSEFVKAEFLPSYEDFMRDLYLYEGVGLFEIQAENSFYYISKDNKKIEIGLLPYKNTNGKVIYPRGRWIGFYNLNEIRFSLENGYKVKPLFIEYWKSDYLPHIKEFVEYWYSLKKSKQGLLSLISKTVLNSLYGKFMQLNEGFDIKLLETKQDYEEYEEIENTGIGINRNEKYKRGKSTYLAVGSYITSYARIELLKKMKYAIEKQAEILYCDTDSLFINRQIFNESDKIGELKLEKQGQNIEIFSAKSYFLNYDNEKEMIKVIKGIPKKSQKINEYDYEYERIIKFNEKFKKNSEELRLGRRREEASILISERLNIPYDVILKSLESYEFRTDVNDEDIQKLTETLGINLNQSMIHSFINKK